MNKYDAAPLGGELDGGFAERGESLADGFVAVWVGEEHEKAAAAGTEEFSA